MDELEDKKPVYYCGDGFELSEAQIKWLNERLGDGVKCKDRYHSAESSPQCSRTNCSASVKKPGV